MRAHFLIFIYLLELDERELSRLFCMGVLCACVDLIESYPNSFLQGLYLRGPCMVHIVILLFSFFFPAMLLDEIE